MDDTGGKLKQLFGLVVRLVYQWASQNGQS